MKIDDNDEEMVTEVDTTPSKTAEVHLDTYTTGVRWNGGGGQCAVSTDTRIHVYNVSHNSGVTYRTSLKHAECLYDWDWSSEETLVTTGRYQPVQVSRVNSESVVVEATYNCINHLDELSHAFSATVDHQRGQIICGLKGELRTFDINRPGRLSVSQVTRDKSHGQNGIISCLAVSPSLPVIAAGSYDRTVGLYSADQGERLCVFRGHQGGLTQVTFSEDGGQLITGGRKDNEIICWDLRQPGQVLWTVNRVVATNQRIGFDTRGKYLISANTDGSVRVWDTSGHVDTCVVEPAAGWVLHADAVTDVRLHPDHEVMATSTGQRHFVLEESCDNESEENNFENSLTIWNISDTLANL